MNYVYILQSIANPHEFYIGLCTDVDSRLKGITPASRLTRRSFGLGAFGSAHYFVDPSTAAAFERYLKSGSGRAFAKKRLR